MRVRAIIRAMFTILFSAHAADWGAWLQRGADQLAQEFGYDSFDTATDAAGKQLDALFSDDESGPGGKDPLSVGHGAVISRGRDFSDENPYAKMRGCAPNANEGKNMCWSTAGVFAENMWCWVETDCHSHEDCRIIYSWTPCYGETMLKGTSKTAYNRQAYASRVSKDGL